MTADAWDAVVASARVADCRAFVHINVLAEDGTAVDGDISCVNEPKSYANSGGWMDFNACFSGKHESEKMHYRVNQEQTSVLQDAQIEDKPQTWTAYQQEWQQYPPVNDRRFPVILW